MVVAQSLLQLHVKATRSEGRIDLHLFSHELIRKLGDIFCKPAVEGDCLHVVRGAENDDKVRLGFDWAMRDSNWDENFARLLVDQS